MKVLIKYKLNLKDNENIPMHYLLSGSFAVALINTICVMPFDAIKSFF